MSFLRRLGSLLLAHRPAPTSRRRARCCCWPRSSSSRSASSTRFTTGVDIESLDPGSLIKLAAAIGAVAAITMTGLLGEVFYSGAVAVSLTHPAHEKPPSIARSRPPARLQAADPGRHRLRRPRDRRPGRLLHPRHPRLRLVRPGRTGGRAGGTDRARRPCAAAPPWSATTSGWSSSSSPRSSSSATSFGELVGHLVHGALGDSFFATWLAESASNIAFTPVFAIAAVLLTLDLIAAKDESEAAVSPARGDLRGWRARLATRSR